MRNDIATQEDEIFSAPEPIPLSGNHHQHLIAGAQDFLEHAVGEVTPKMLAYLEYKLAELQADLAAVRMTMN